ncbi:MAG TPA: NAD(P)-binding domain-containing protein [Sphingomicrobium sp.]|nr:NAD(P)-binding domain-containing protein [Sphingomicrobium sp.]
MTIGIIGAGTLGSNIARLFAKSGISATIANRHGPESLAPLIEEVGPSITAGATEEAAAADIVLVAVRWVDIKTVLSDLPAWNGRIVIDATNPVEFLDPGAPKDPSNPLAAFGIRAAELGGRYSSEIVRDFVPGARLVKAFNHVAAELLPRSPALGGQRVLFYSGDDADSKTKVREIIERTGHFPVDLGVLEVGGTLASPPYGSLASLELIKA